MPEQASDTLKGKTALVTGAARRIGRAICMSLAAEGTNAVIHDRRSMEGECQEVCDEMGKLGVRSWIVTGDFEKSGYDDLMKRALGAAGTIDILINNASMFLADTLRDASFENLARHIQINAWAPFSLSRDFARLANKGKIIHLLDTRISGYDWSHISYGLSKDMLAKLTEMTALEFAPDISVNGVAPGLILPPEGRDMSYLRELADTVPMKRHGGPEDVTEAILFLLRSRFITGQVIFVDGGRHLGTR